LSRITNRIRSSITELSFHGIPSSRPLRGQESVTHVSGTFCYLCLGTVIQRLTFESPIEWAVLWGTILRSPANDSPVLRRPTIPVPIRVSDLRAKEPGSPPLVFLLSGRTLPSVDLTVHRLEMVVCCGQGDRDCVCTGALDRSRIRCWRCRWRLPIWSPR